MAYLKTKPTSNGRRGLVVFKKDLAKKDANGKKIRPEKSLLLPKRRTNGRNSKGHITALHRGGGHKRKYRVIDFKRDKFGVPAKVASIEYDPNRSADIALLHYADGEKRYILAPKALAVGAEVRSGPEAPFKPGNAMALKSMPIGTTVHAIEMLPGKGAGMVRSAGTFAQLVAREKGYAALKLPSGEMRLVRETCMATIGAVGNSSHNLNKDGKAGRSRWKGRRPHVRGTAMNPVDHHNGGGEGRNNSKSYASRLGVYSKGLRTRSKKKSNRLILKDRRKK